MAKDKRVRIERINAREESGDPHAPTKLYYIYVDDELVDSASTKEWALHYARMAKEALKREDKA